MLLRRLPALLTCLTTLHFVLVAGELECAESSDAASVRSAPDGGAADCDHAGRPSAAHTSHSRRGPGGRTHDHGAACCVAVHSCSGLLATVSRSRQDDAALAPRRILPADAFGVATLFFPPDPPPPKA